MAVSGQRLARAGAVTMLRLKPQQRLELSETLRDLANLGFAALVLGQFLADRPVSWWLVAVGLLMWVVFVGFALFISGASDGKRAHTSR